MPELPEVEAWVRALDGPVSASPVLRAGPAHIATLKTFDPPLATLEGRRFEGAERRGKWLLFPTEDGELQLRIHLMSAGRIRFLASGAKGPKSPAFRLRFESGYPRFDMGLGNTGYKSHFRVEETALDNLTCAQSLAGSAFSLVYHHAKPLKNVLRRLVPKLR